MLNMPPVDSLHAKLIRVGVFSFGFAGLGVLLGFIGWYLIDSLTVAKIGFIFAFVGVVAGFVVVGLGVLTQGRKAISGSSSAMTDIRNQIK